MKFFDTHAHIGLIYDDPIEQLRVIQQAKQAGVTRIVCINNSLYDFNKVYANLKSVSGIYYAVGVAPSEVTNPGADWVNTVEKGLELPNVVAVGETGLGLYEAIHGSAPTLAGKNVCNPAGTILSAALMLRHSLNAEKEASAIENAVASAIECGFGTQDISSMKQSTTEFTDEIISRIKV